MSNILAALFGGAGAGLSSYGTQRIREQDQERIAAQRMAELQQQESSRIAQAREQAALRAAQLKEDGEQAAIIARAAGIPLPEGARINSQGVGILGQIAANKRFEQGQAGQMERLEKTLGSRMDQIAAQGDINKAIAAMGNDTRKTIAAMMEAGRNQRDATGTTKPQPTVQDFYTKFLGQQDENGLPMTPEKAMAAAQRAYQVLTGAQNPSRAPQQGNPGEGDLARKAQQKIQSIMSDPSLSPEDKQDMVQQVNDILRSRISAMRGGR